MGGTTSADKKVSEQCGIAASKGNYIFGLIRRNMAYRPHLEYCIQAWIPYHKKDIDILEQIQRRATKIILELREISYEEHLKKCSLTTLERERLQEIKIMFLRY